MNPKSKFNTVIRRQSEPTIGRMLGAVLLFFLCASQLLAQNSRVVGSVTDAAGAVIRSAKLTIVQQGTGFSQSTATDASGEYTFPVLPIGRYTLTASSAGFGDEKITDIKLDINQAARINLHLKIAVQQTSVKVSGQADLLNTQSSELGQVINNQLLQNIPLDGRDFTKLTLLTSGASTNVEGSIAGGIIVDGERPTSNQYQIDGVDTTVGGGEFGYRTPGSGVPQGAAGTSSSLVTVDSIDEFKVQTANYGAQYGTESGGIINIVTKSGTDQFHGSAYNYARNAVMDANDYFLNQASIKRPPFVFNDVGGTLGGPIRRQRTFFFTNYENLQESYNRAVNGTTLSNAARVAAEPVMKPLVDFFPLPTGPDNPDGSAPFIGTAPGNGGENDFSIKVDHQITNADHIFARYSIGASNSAVGGGLGAFPLTSQTDIAKIQTVAIEETHTFSPGLINTFNAGFARDYSDLYSLLHAGPNTSGDPFGQDGQPVQPQVAIIPISLRGGSSPATKSAINDFTYHDNLTWSHGKHTINSGIDVRRVQDNLLNYANHAGLFIWLKTVDFEQDRPFFFVDFTGNLQEGARFWNIAPYIQDDWRITPKLTFNMGLRYELNTVPTEAHNRFRNITQITDISTSLLAPYGAPLYRGQHTNFAPRLGFAYSPSSTVVIRAAGGIFYDTASQLAGFLFFNPGIVAENFIPGPELSPTGPASYPINPNLLVSKPSPNPPYTNSVVLDPNLVNAYTEAYTLNIQKSFGSSTVFELGYVGNVGRHLYRQRVLNLFPTSDWSTPSNSSNTPPNPNFPTGGITLVDNSANSNYNSLQANLTERLGKRLQGTLAYTWSHSIDDTSTTGAYGSVNSNTFPTNPDNLAADRGNSDFDITSNLTLGFTYQPPFEMLGSLPKRLTEGWAFSGLLSYHTPFPYTPLLGSSTVNDGDPNLATEERPSIVPGVPVYIHPHGLPRIANSAAYQCPGGGSIASGCPVNGIFGNVGRNSLRAFPFKQLDFSASKDFTIHNETGLEFRAEFFNIFNSVNFANPGATNTNLLTATQFGQPLAMANYSATGIAEFFNSGAPRNIQVAVRFHF